MFPQQSTQSSFPVMQPRFPMAPALYVGNLHESIDDQALYDFFSRFGSIHFIRVMRDVTTGKSRGYGFVNFVSARDAESAKQYAQYENLAGQSIRIMFRTTINQDANVVVKNLDKSINEKLLHEFFNRCGTVLSVHIRRFRNISMGFVSYSSTLEAESALNSLNGEKLGELNVVLEKYVQKKDRHVKKSIYLKDLTFQDEEEANKWITSTFGEFGPLVSYKAFTYKPGIYSAFICFKNDDDSEKAYNVFSQSPTVFPNGQKAYISWHSSKINRKEALSKSNVYVKNLKLETTPKDLETIFRQLGKVENVALREWESKDKKRRAKFGFVLFDKEETALSVLRNISQVPELQVFAIEQSKVEVFPFQTKKQRQQFILSTQRAKQYQEALKFQHYQYAMAGNPMAPFTRFNAYGPNPMAFNHRRTPYQNRGQPVHGQNYSRPPGNNQNRTGPNQANHAYAQNNRHFNNNFNNGNQQRRNYNNENQGRQNNNFRPQNDANNRRGNANVQPKALPQAQQQPQPQFTPSNIRSKLNELMGMESEKRKMILGESLYPKVLQKTSDKIAPKITGMLIDLDIEEIFDLIENSESLQERITEALELLNDPAAQ